MEEKINCAVKEAQIRTIRASARLIADAAEDQADAATAAVLLKLSTEFSQMAHQYEETPHGNQ